MQISHSDNLRVWTKVRPTHGNSSMRLVITVAGEVDLDTATQLSDPLLTRMQQGTFVNDGDVVIDLTRVTFMDSIGLSTLVRMNRKVRAFGGTLSVVCEATSRPAALIRLAGLDRKMTVHQSIADI